MSETLTELLIEVATSGVAKVQKEINSTEKSISALENKEKKLNETIKKGGDDAEKASKQLEKLHRVLDYKQKKLAKLNNTWEAHYVKLKQNIAPILKIAGQFAGLGIIAKKTAQFAEEVLEVAEAAENAKKSFEDYQAELLKTNKYKVFTKEDVKNAKEYEMVQRDIRAGFATISANLGRTFLPVLIGIMKIVRNVTDFFARHSPLIRIGLYTISTVLGLIGLKYLPLVIKQIWNLAKAFIGLIAANPVLSGIIAAVTVLILLLDDIYAWMNGGVSAFGDFWTKLFGDPKEFKKKLENLLNWLKEHLGIISGVIVSLSTLIAMGVGPKIQLAIKGIFDLLLKIPAIIGAIGTAIRTVTAFMIANPWVAILTSVIGLVVLLWKNWDKVVNAVKNAINGVKDFLHLNANKNVSANIQTTNTEVQNSKAGKKADSVDGSHASGLDYVPYDGYIAELHKGERVQTAQEAADWRANLQTAQERTDFKSNLTKAQSVLNFADNHPLNAVPSGAFSNAYNNSVNNNNTTAQNINISGITINTQATDAKGIANDLADYIKQAVISLDDGMLA